MYRFRCMREPVRLAGCREGAVWIGWRRSSLVGTRVQRATAVPECRRDHEYARTAPFTITRNLVEYLLAASVDMAPALRYPGVDMFEYLVNSRTGNWVFLATNPVYNSSLLPQGQPSIRCWRRSWCAGKTSIGNEERRRIGPCCRGWEDWVYEDGKTQKKWASPRPGGTLCIVGTAFDLLLAKVVVRGRDLREATQRGTRALRETSVRNEGGVKMNRTGVGAHEEWEEAKCDTMRLERELGRCDWDWGGGAQAA
ncbi:hypothetical protein FIBSPDRAFT_905421, partial [Athelia psychrophila]